MSFNSFSIFIFHFIVLPIDAIDIRYMSDACCQYLTEQIIVIVITVIAPTISNAP